MVGWVGRAVGGPRGRARGACERLSAVSRGRMGWRRVRPVERWRAVVLGRGLLVTVVAAEASTSRPPCLREGCVCKLG